MPLVARVFQLAAKHMLRHRVAAQVAVSEARTLGVPLLPAVNPAGAAASGDGGGGSTSNSPEKAEGGNVVVGDRNHSVIPRGELLGKIEDVMAGEPPGVEPSKFIGQGPRLMWRGSTEMDQR